MSEGEGMERLARVLIHAEVVWNDQEQARRWMNSPHRELGEGVPLELAQTETRARQVTDLLDKLFYGLPA